MGKKDKALSAVDTLQTSSYFSDITAFAPEVNLESKWLSQLRP
jgi:hypothetical protein